MRSLFLLALAAILLLGCDPFQFDEIEDGAPVRVLEAPDSYPKGKGFGTLVVGYSGVVDERPISQLIAGAGENTPHLVYRGWDGGSMVLGSHTSSGCDDMGDCEDTAGAAMAGLPLWRAGTAAEARMCVLVTAPASGLVLVRCGNVIERVPAPPMALGSRLGQSVASLASVPSLGIAMLGAPAQGNGALYILPDAMVAEPVLLGVEVFVGGDGLGDSIAVTKLDTSTALVALGAPGVGRVVVLTVSRGGAGYVAETRACLSNGTTNWGSELVWGDADGDGLDELFVAAGDQADTDEDVHMFRGSELPPGGGGCSSWTATALACPEELDGLPCAGNTFGASLAVGDVNADGFGDLLVGAPTARVGGHSEAGAVYVLPGSASGPMAEAADVLTVASSEAGDRLGASLTTLGAGLEAEFVSREEIVAGAPGMNAAVVFLCSGLPNDAPSDLGDRCVPSTP